MKFWVGVTDNAWFNFLSKLKPDEVNFWQPGGNVSFGTLKPGESFLFKLHSPLITLWVVAFLSGIPIYHCPYPGKPLKGKTVQYEIRL